MMYYTHLVFALFLSLVVSEFVFISNVALFVFVALFFSLLPDIDDTRSKFGRRLIVISFFLKVFFGHRKLLHSFFVPLFLFFVGYFLISWEVGVAMSLGYFSHLLLDMVNRAGIMPFYPLLKWKISGFIHTHSFLEKVFFVLLCFGCAIVIVGRVY